MIELNWTTKSKQCSGIVAQFSVFRKFLHIFKLCSYINFWQFFQESVQLALPKNLARNLSGLKFTNLYFHSFLPEFLIGDFWSKTKKAVLTLANIALVFPEKLVGPTFSGFCKKCSSLERSFQGSHKSALFAAFPPRYLHCTINDGAIHVTQST